jgi:hypothetical protein
MSLKDAFHCGLNGAIYMNAHKMLRKIKTRKRIQKHQTSKLHNTKPVYCE